MSKIIQVAQSPINCLLRWTFTLGLSCTIPESKEWLLSNFINISANSSFNNQTELFVDFWRGGRNELIGNNPYLFTRVLGYDLLKENLAQEPDLHRFIIEAIERGYCCAIFVNETFLSHSKHHGKELPFPHHVFIHGYSDEGYVGIGYGNQENSKYSTLGSIAIKRQELFDASCSMNELIKSSYIHEQHTVLLKAHGKDVDLPDTYRLNLAFICYQLKSYLNSNAGFLGSDYLSTEGMVFGLDVYDLLESYFKKAQHGELVNYRRDVRHLTTFIERMQLMKIRIEYLQERFRNLKDLPIEEIGQYLASAINCRLKIMMSNQLEIGNGPDIVLSYLGRLKNWDEAITSKLLNSLQDILD